jgi:hypothetical protein
MGQSFFQVPRDGRWTVGATLVSDGGVLEPALALSLLVLPDVAVELRLHPEALRAMLAGLDFVRRHVQDSNE